MRVAFVVNDTRNVDYVGIIDRESLTTSEIIKLSGGNLGNFAFRYGLRRMLNGDVGYIDWRSEPSAVRAEFDVILVAEANLVNPNVDYGGPANFLKKCNLPVLICGIGSQAPISVKSPGDFPDLKTGTKEFLKVCADLSDEILVRGDFTKDVIIEQTGVRNVRSAGCPSYLINSRTNLWERVKRKAVEGIDSSRLSITEGNYHPVNRPKDGLDLERRLFGVVRDFGADYVGQQQKGVIELAMGMREEKAADPLYGLGGYVAPKVRNDALVEIMSNRARAFGRTDEWIRYLSGRSATTGTRIHGCILSLQGETPSVPVVHDLRTRELTETLGFPTLGVKDILQTNSSSDIIDLISKVYDKFDSNVGDAVRAELATVYRSAIESVGLKASSSLQGLSGEAAS